MWGFPEIRCTFLEVPILRNVICKVHIRAFLGKLYEPQTSQPCILVSGLGGPLVGDLCSFAGNTGDRADIWRYIRTVNMSYSLNS